MVFYITFSISPVTGSPFRGPCAARRSVNIWSHFLSVSPPGPPAWYHIQSSWISKLLWIYYLGESACFKLVTVLIFWFFSKMGAVVIFKIFILYFQSGLATSCKDLYTNTPINGYHCETNLNTMVTLHQTQFSQCVWRCLGRKTCRYINHNFAIGRCELGLGQCESLRPNETSSIMVFGPLWHGCLRWGSSVEPGRVPIQVLNTHYLYVARIVSENNILIGRFNSKSETFWANREGIFIGPIHTTDQEI